MSCNLHANNNFLDDYSCRHPKLNFKKHLNSCQKTTTTSLVERTKTLVTQQLTFWMTTLFEISQSNIINETKCQFMPLK